MFICQRIFLRGSSSTQQRDRFVRVLWEETKLVVWSRVSRNHGGCLDRLRHSFLCAADPPFPHCWGELRSWRVAVEGRHLRPISRLPVVATCVLHHPVIAMLVDLNSLPLGRSAGYISSLILLPSTLPIAPPFYLFIFLQSSVTVHASALCRLRPASLVANNSSYRTRLSGWAGTKQCYLGINRCFQRTVLGGSLTSGTTD